jgi:hypothetical protein
MHWSLLRCNMALVHVCLSLHISLFCDFLLSIQAMAVAEGSSCWHCVVMLAVSHARYCKKGLHMLGYQKDAHPKHRQRAP